MLNAKMFLTQPKQPGYYLVCHPRSLPYIGVIRSVGKDLLLLYSIDNDCEATIMENVEKNTLFSEKLNITEQFGFIDLEEF